MRKKNNIKSFLFIAVVGAMLGFAPSNLYAEDKTGENVTIEQYKTLVELITTLQKKVEEANSLSNSTEKNCKDLVTSNLEASISYTDNKANIIMTDVKSYVNSVASTTEKNCKELIKSDIDSIKSYADNKANTALEEAKNYAKSLTGSDSVTNITTGSASGTIAIKKNDKTYDVSVKGLGTAAYTNSSDYAKAKHTHTIDSSISETSKNPVQNKVIKEYIDAQIASALKEAKAYTDSATKGEYNIKNVDNGYIKLPNGVIIQWINKYKCKTQGSTVVKLPTSFTTTNYAVIGNVITGSDVVYVTHHQMVINGKTLTSFIATNNNHKGANWEGEYQFIAIGK